MTEEAKKNDEWTTNHWIGLAVLCAIVLLTDHLMWSGGKGGLFPHELYCGLGAGTTVSWGGKSEMNVDVFGNVSWQQTRLGGSACRHTSLVKGWFN